MPAARSAIESYSDDELASLIGTKRMSDYKAALTQRNIRPSTSRLQAS
jgi:glutamate synthase (NADPH/NADH) large chain